MTIELSEKQAAFVRARVADGTFASQEEVIEAAFGELEAELEHLGDLQALRAAIAEGDASGIYEGDVFADIRRELGLPAA